MIIIISKVEQFHFDLQMVTRINAENMKTWQIYMVTFRY